MARSGQTLTKFTNHPLKRSSARQFSISTRAITHRLTSNAKNSSIKSFRLCTHQKQFHFLFKGIEFTCCSRWNVEAHKSNGCELRTLSKTIHAPHTRTRSISFLIWNCNFSSALFVSSDIDYASTTNSRLMHIVKQFCFYTPWWCRFVALLHTHADDVTQYERLCYELREQVE